MKKIALILCILMIIPAICLSVSADTANSDAYAFPVNAINKQVAEGQVLLITAKYASNLSTIGSTDWCRVGVFDWSSEDGAYVLISVDTQVGNEMKKNAVIPPHGFAIVTNLGNDYPSLGMSGPNYVNESSTYTYNNIGNVAIGSKAYLTGINLSGGTIEYEGDIGKYYDTELFKTNAYVTVSSEKPEGAYTPDTSVMLPAPNFTDAKEAYTPGDVTLKWSAPENALSYRVNVCESIINTNGKTVLSETTESTEITIPEGELTVGGKYTVTVIATDGYFNSTMAVHQFSTVSARSLEGKFEGMTVVAFGDSITHWQGWVDMIGGELGVDVINSGIGGDTTNHALARIEKDVIAKSPDLVFVNFGMNDQFYDSSTGSNLVPIEQYEANYRQIIEKIKATGSDIILIAVHDVYSSGTDYSVPTSVDTYNVVVKKLAEEYELGFLDINAKAQELLSTITLDGVHLNEAGQKNYCKWIADYAYEYIDSKSDSTEVGADEESESADDTDGGIDAWVIIAIAAAVLAIAGVAVAAVVKSKKKESK